jgi:RNA polymerase sigma factor FliA
MLVQRSRSQSRSSRSPKSRTREQIALARPARTGCGESAELVTQHLGLVHHVARQLASRLSTEADFDELVSAGSVGLLQAAESFEAARGLSFSTFAVPRIRGAMLDELRRQDHMPRNVRRRSRDVARARDHLAGALNREPTPAEISAHLRVPAAQLHRWQFDAHSSGVCSLQQRTGTEADVTLGDLLPDDRTASVDDLLTREQEVAELRRAIATLKEQERTVLALNFFEELKLQEIAQVLELSVCRISQIRTAALEKLRSALSALRAA